MSNNGLWFVMPLTTRRARKSDTLKQQCKSLGLSIPIHACSELCDAPPPIRDYLSNNIIVLVNGDKLQIVGPGVNLRDILAEMFPLNRLYILLPDDVKTSKKVSTIIYNHPISTNHETILIDKVRLDDIDTDERIPSGIRYRVGYLPFIAVVTDTSLLCYNGLPQKTQLTQWLSNPTVRITDTKKWGLTHRGISVDEKNTNEWNLLTLSDIYK